VLSNEAGKRMRDVRKGGNDMPDEIKDLELLCAVVVKEEKSNE
jgi:hypothetical protein